MRDRFVCLCVHERSRACLCAKIVPRSFPVIIPISSSSTRRRRAPLLIRMTIVVSPVNLESDDPLVKKGLISNDQLRVDTKPLKYKDLLTPNHRDHETLPFLDDIDRIRHIPDFLPISCSPRAICKMEIQNEPKDEEMNGAKGCQTDERI